MAAQLDYIVLPGINGSDDSHWQTRWEADAPRMRRFEPSSWDLPDLDDWQRALSAAVAAADGPVVLVAHSLSNILIGHWAQHSPLAAAVTGAFLVAVPDPCGPRYPTEAGSFTRPPERPLPFPSLVVASDDDPYGDGEYTRHLAQLWGSGLVLLPGLGHINSSSGIGAWQVGRDLLTAFVAGGSDRAAHQRAGGEAR